MKKILTLALALGCGVAMAQKADNVGIGTTKPDPSAILDLSSNNKGLLIPRMSQAQRDAIQTPAVGLMVFQTDQTPGLYTFDGTTWQPNARTAATAVAGAWDKQGNAIDATDFLGSTNNFPLVFKVNNQLVGKLGYQLNTFFGDNAGLNNTGSYNVGIGFDALKNSTPAGSSNVAIGYSSMRLNQAGIHNLALGAQTLENNVSGNYNAAIGAAALFLSTGSDNVAIGVQALYNASNRSTAIGAYSGKDNTGSNNVFIGYKAGMNANTGSNMLYIANSEAVNPLIRGDFQANWLRVNSKTTGYLAVGDFDAMTPMPTPAGYRLIVQDGILTEKLKVALRTDGTNWADYVFDPSYKLMSLEEVEKYTKTNKHLPNVPSADEITKEGIDVAKVSKMFMEKIEELTLHIIDLNKRIKELEQKK